MSQETEYLIRDEGGNIFGPATMTVLRQWIGEGRITPTMEIGAREAGHFMPAGQIPELRDALMRAGMVGPVAGPAGPAGAAGARPYASAEQASGPAGIEYRPVMPVTNPMAITSLVVSLAGIMFCPWVTEILAVVFGHIARKQIRDDPGRYSGDGMAQAGLIIGYIVLGLSVLAALAYVLLIIIVLSSRGRM